MSESVEQAARPAVHYHHGRTPAAWAGTVIAAVAFTVAAIGSVLGPNWLMIWIGAALLVVSLIVGVALRRAGYGQAE